MNSVDLNTKNALLLKEYLERLGSGEALESVQKDFREAFGNADAEDIVKAEQILINTGTSTAQVEKLCDLHSSLFHDQPAPSKAKAVGGPLKMKTIHSDGCGSHGHNYEEMPSALLAEIVGHPLNILTLEPE